MSNTITPTVFYRMLKRIMGRKCQVPSKHWRNIAIALIDAVAGVEC